MFSTTSPGPGQYQIPSRVSEGPKYILGLKPELNPFKNKTEPGPGLYDPKKPDRQFSYSIRKKNAADLSDFKITPGPGHYIDER